MFCPTLFRLPFATTMIGAGFRAGPMCTVLSAIQGSADAQDKVVELASDLRLSCTSCIHHPALIVRLAALARVESALPPRTSRRSGPCCLSSSKSPSLDIISPKPASFQPDLVTGSSVVLSFALLLEDKGPMYDPPSLTSYERFEH